MYGYIYQTMNLITGIKYIGKKKSSTFLKDYYGSGIAIKAAIKKYGKQNFDVKLIEWCRTREELSAREIFYIRCFNADRSDQYYNISAGGEGGNTYSGKSESEMNDIKRKISIRNSGTRNGNKGQYVGPLNGMYGKHASIECRLKKSNSLKAKRTSGKYKKYTPLDPIKLASRSEYQKTHTALWTVINMTTGQRFEHISWKSVQVQKMVPEAFFGIYQTPLPVFERRWFHGQ